MRFTLQLGDIGAAVIQLQKRLNSQGAKLMIDGLFGQATQQAVFALQEKVGLVIDGVVGNKTQAVLQAEQPVSKLLSMHDLYRAVTTLDVPLACIRAINQVESRGCGFLNDGRPAILFERHIMYRQLKAKGKTIDQLNDLTTRYSNIVNPQRGGYSGGEAEYMRLKLAMQIDHDCAIEASSWGLFQIMGYHWQRLSYSNANDFYTAMCQSEGQQLDAFVRFIQTDQNLYKALKSRKWAEFARLYNGPSYKDNLYDIKLERAYEKYQLLEKNSALSSNDDIATTPNEKAA